MQTFIELLTATFTAGEVKVFEFSGDYFEIIDAPYPLTVELSDRNGGLAGKLTLAEQSFNIKAGYSRITLTSPTAQTVRIGYGSGEVGNRRTAGIVSVVDGGRARTLAGVAYTGSCYCGAVVGQFSHSQIWNPTTTKNIIISQVILTSASSQNLVLRAHAAAFATVASQANPASKKIGGADSGMQFFTTNNVGTAATGKFFGNLGVTPFNTTTYRFSEPLIITPLQSLVVCSQTANTDVSATFEMYEEQI